MMNDEIYENYYVENILFDSPCCIDGIEVYPIQVINWKAFQKYIPLFILSKDHYKLESNEDLLRFIIVNNSMYPNKSDINNELLIKMLSTFCNAFNIICRCNDFTCKIEKDGFLFYRKDSNYSINKNNFNDIRKVILKQNIIFEPIIYESKFKEKWANSVRRGRAKKAKKIPLSDIVNIVREGIGISYDEINKMNMFQLNVDFKRLQNTKNFESTMLLRTTYGIDLKKLPNVDYVEPIIEELMRNPELDYFKDFDMGDVVESLK